MENKISPEEVREAIQGIQDTTKICKHCSHNPISVPPLYQMVNLKLTPLTTKTLDWAAKEYNIEEKSCLLCLAMYSFLKMPKNKQLAWLKEQA